MHILTLFETRVKFSGIRTAGTFWRICSPAVDGVYGTEIWINKTLPFVYDSQKLYYVKSVNDITILQKDPRRFFIVCVVNTSRFIVVAMHALHIGAKESLHEWWGESKRLCFKFCRNYPGFFMGWMLIWVLLMVSLPMGALSFRIRAKRNMISHSVISCNCQV